jgi:glyoxylase-like metal-dependent hydrolase (beta-lactamase superfamily II)
MFASSDRRDFIRMCMAGAAGLCVPFSIRGNVSLQAVKLSDKLVLISGAGANVMMAAGPDGLAMVDGGLPEHSAELLSIVTEQSVAEQGQANPVKVLFNTNWHLEHTGSNEPLGKAGVKIVAHANTRKWLKTRVFVEMQNRNYTPRPPEAIPTETFYTSAKMSFGQVPIEYGHLPFANSDGDIYVFFPESNVMMVSDVLSVGRYPFMDYNSGGWIGGMVEATSVLLKMVDAKTQVVPGLGPVQTKQDLQAQRDMVTAVGTRILDMIQQGKGYSEIVAAAPTKEFDARWGQPDQFVTMTYKGIMRNLHDVGVIRSQ